MPLAASPALAAEPCDSEYAFPYTVTGSTPAERAVDLAQAIVCSEQSLGADVIDLGGAEAEVSAVSNNSLGVNNAFAIISDDLTVTNGTITRASSAVDMRFFQVEGTLTLRDLVMSGADSGGDGGALYVTSGATAGLLSVELRGNRGNFGGAIFASTGSTLLVTNSLISGNTSFNIGGAIRNRGTTTVSNSTIAGNYGGSEGGGIATAGTPTTTINNSIVAGNNAPIGADTAGAITSINNSFVGVDPSFVAPVTASSTPTTAGDYQLDSDSTAVDAGDNSLVPSGVTFDLVGNPRFTDDPEIADTGVGTAPIVDLGAYERTFVEAPGVVAYPHTVVPGLVVTAPYPDYEVAIDCELYAAADDPRDWELVWVPGGSLSVEFSCDDVSLTSAASMDGTLGIPASGQAVPSGSGPVTYDVGGDTQVVWSVDGVDFSVSYLPSIELSDPAGEVIATNTLHFPAGGGTTADFVTDDPDGLAGLAECDTYPGTKAYRTQVLTVTEAGEHTFRVVGVAPQQSGADVSFEGGSELYTALPNPWGDYVPSVDPWIALYETFDASDVESTLITCNDDSQRIDDEVSFPVQAHDSSQRFLDNYYSEIVVDLEPGTYTLVVATYDIVSGTAPDQAATPERSLAPVDYSLDDFVAQSIDLEVWASADAAGSDDENAAPDDELAATGIGGQLTGAVGWLGVLLMLGGVALIVRRRALAVD